jgi:hypothetical protein
VGGGGGGGGLCGGLSGEHDREEANSCAVLMSKENVDSNTLVLRSEEEEETAVNPTSALLAMDLIHQFREERLDLEDWMDRIS